MDNNAAPNGTVQKVDHPTLVAKAREAKASGRFFSAEVIKRTTGEVRYFRAIRGGVTAYTTGEGLKFDPERKGLLVVWEALNADGDKENLAYRMLNLEGLRVLIVDGVRYELQG